MYPGGNKAKENHKKGICSDGAMQKLEPSAQNEDPPRDGEPGKKLAPPDWPQPKGLFTGTEGKMQFHPTALFDNLREIYNKIVVNSASSGPLALEHAAFAALIARRTVHNEDGSVYFKLFDVENAPDTPQALIVVENNHKYLRIDELKADSRSETSTAAGLQVNSHS